MADEGKKRGRCVRCHEEKELYFRDANVYGVNPPGEWLCEQCAPTMRPPSLTKMKTVPEK